MEVAGDDGDSKNVLWDEEWEGGRMEEDMMDSDSKEEEDSVDMDCIHVEHDIQEDFPSNGVLPFNLLLKTHCLCAFSL
jgi:hypothetical protein